MTVLQNLINNQELVWKKSLNDKIEEFLIKLSKESIEELSKKKEVIRTTEIDHYPILKNEIMELKKKSLIDGIGFFIIDGTCFEDFDKEQIREIFRIISTGLGELYVQNIKNEKFVTISNEGKSMKTGGRYHQTKEGGSYHTDSPQWSKVPDIIGLFCINPAKSGGESKFVSAYTVHNKMLESKPEFLKILYTKFHFDKRGEFEKNESPTVFEPIFRYDNERLKFRYLRSYIDAGQTLVNEPLTNEQNLILNKLDEIIHDEELSVTYNLRQSDMTFFNNHRIIHGRTGFEDFEKVERKRLMIRTWIKDENFYE